MDMTSRTVLVTGASSGIGREAAIILSRLGARVILVARNQEKLVDTQKHLSEKGHVIEPFDLQLIDSIPAWLKQISQKIGPLDGLVHSAGIHVPKPLRVLKYDDLKKVFDLNVASAVSLAKGFRQKGVCQSNSSIVLLSSVVGLVGQSGISAYSASKGALISLTKSLALELSSENIRVNCVAPGVIKTGMTDKFSDTMPDEYLNNVKKMHPLGFGNPEDVAHAIAFLLADTSRWITGSILTVDGGYTAH
jgi:3-oxoacyl-[acyl-carrier protein] reductase